ncbi:MAG: DUF4252 domain-containing protein [Bacteroidales bacterium]|nr:DUF4252 domain-containing protein [Bacteroidales bacterium]
MKKFITLLLLLILPLGGLAGNNVPKAKLSAFISEYRHCPGVELVKMGAFPTMIIKNLIRANIEDDPEDRAAMEAISGVRKIMIFEFEDASAAVRNRMVRNLDEILGGSELLMEVKDDDDRMLMYGVVDEKSGKVRDFVLYAPDECALICLFGSISMNAIAKLASYND